MKTLTEIFQFFKVFSKHKKAPKKNTQAIKLFEQISSRQHALMEKVHVQSSKSDICTVYLV